MFLSYFFDNGSPCNWDYKHGELVVELLYDHEAGAVNKAAGHFHFAVENPNRQPVRIRIKFVNNVWNGELGSPFEPELPSYYSEDGKNWQVFIWRQEDNGDLVAELGSSPFFYLARLEPYTENDLRRLCDTISQHPAVTISHIGTTVEQRPLEMIHLGSGRRRILLRARAHPWEPGGNWVIEGLISEFIVQYDAAPENLRDIAFDILPLANKDGVARGLTRFNLRGADLNRGFSRPRAELADCAPENSALLQWLDDRRAAGALPMLALDLHNDCNGGLLIPRGNNEQSMWQLAEVMRRYTFGPETVTVTPNRDGFTAGMQAHYGIATATLELNAKYIRALRQPPTAALWRQFGHGLFRTAMEFAGAKN